MAQQNQQNTTLVRRLFDEVFTKGNLNVLDELMAPNVRLTDPAVGNTKTGIAAIKDIENKYKKAFPSKKVQIDDLLTTDDRVIVRWTAQGVHKGEFQGISPTNQQFKVSGISIYRISNGKISEINQSWDRLGLFEQIGEIQTTTALHF